jgi:putative ABC transport system substrate-binding protein
VAGGDGVKRREFITLIGGAALGRPLAARAQQVGKLPKVGFLRTGAISTTGPWTAAFVQRMRELGWVEGHTVEIEYRSGDGRVERFAEIAAEFAWLKVDVIVTSGAAVLSVKQATSSIPIVFVPALDPVGSGLVASLARPGGNATGLSTQAPDLASKRVELLREAVPGLRRLAIMANFGYPAAEREVGEAKAAARTLGLELVKAEIWRAEDIAPAFDALKGRADALYVVIDPLVNTNHLRISTLALGVRLPTIFGTRHYTAAGGLMSYGPNFLNLHRRAADFVDKILRGAKPGDIPVEQPTRFDLVVNLTTAKAIGLVVPPTLLARADEVIE